LNIDPLISFSFVDHLNDNQKFLILVIFALLKPGIDPQIQLLHRLHLRQLD
jgi:hypothetical protein